MFESLWGFIVLLLVMAWAIISLGILLVFVCMVIDAYRNWQRRRR